MARQKALQRSVHLRWPMGGLYKRQAFQQQPPFTTPDCLNVRPDDSQDRERGGSRPALRKWGDVRIDSNPVRMVATIDFIESSTQKSRVVASAGGLLLYENDSGTMTAAAGSTANLLSPDNLIEGLPHKQILYMADHDETPQVARSTDGILTANTNGEFTKLASALGGFTGVSTTQDVVVIENAGARSTEVWELTIDGSPDGGTLKLAYGGHVTSDITFDDVFGDIDTIMEALPSIGSGNVTVTGGALPAKVTITFAGDLSGINAGPITVFENAITKSGNIVAVNLKRLTYGGQDIGLNAKWRVTLTGNPTAGSWGLAYGGETTWFQTQVMTITNSGTVSGGNFKIRWQGDETESLAYNASTDTVRNSLNKLVFRKGTGLRSAKTLAVTGSAPDWVVTLTNHRELEKQWDFPLPDFEINQDTLSGGGTYVTSITTSGEGGTLTFDESADDVKTQLQLLGTIGPDNVIVTKEEGSYIIELVRDLAGKAGGSELQAIDLSLTSPGDPPFIVERLQEPGSTTETAVGSTTSSEGTVPDNTSAVGVYEISSVTNDTNLILKATFATKGYTGLTFRIERGPKKWGNPTDDNITFWLADRHKGYVPVGRPIFAVWRDRAVLAGGYTNPHMIEMSRQGDLNDWDYFATERSAGRAVAATATRAGGIGGHIKGLVPLGDHSMIVFCRSSTWIFRGDPAAGGRLDNISERVGCVDSGAWAKTPEDMVYFMSRDGLYVIPPGNRQRVYSVSRERLPKELLNLDTSKFEVLLEHDLRHRGLHIYITPKTTSVQLARSGKTVVTRGRYSLSSRSMSGNVPYLKRKRRFVQSPSQVRRRKPLIIEQQKRDHYWVDLKQTHNQDQPVAGGFFPVLLADEIEPLSIVNHRDSVDSESTVIHGGRDGWLRRYRFDTPQLDEGTSQDHSFRSYVTFGPFRLGSGERGGKLIALNGSISGAAVRWGVRGGDSAEAAFKTKIRESGDWTIDGYNHTVHPRVAGYAALVTLEKKPGVDAAWSFEELEARITPGSRRRA